METRSRSTKTEVAARLDRGHATNCVILQPSYIPWRGYFHQIHLADTFVFLDDVQFDVRGWRNRNRILGPNGPFWLTVPIHSRHIRSKGTQIHQVEIDWSQPWSGHHLKSFETSYAHAPYFETYHQLLSSFYARQDRYLADFVIDFTIEIAQQLGIDNTTFMRSSSLDAPGRRSERILHILQELGARRYITGPSARSYLDENLLGDAGITVEYMVYDYPAYTQLYPGFEPQVSVLDLLLMEGANAPSFIWDLHS